MNDEAKGIYDVTCSIVTFNSDPEELVRAINSFLATSLRVKVMVVDNSPGDTLRALAESAGAHYRQSPRNVGFGSGHNLAIRECLKSSKYHLVLNPDAHLECGALERMFAYMEANTRVGLLSPKVVFPDGRLQYSCKLMPAPSDLIARWVFRDVLAKPPFRHGPGKAIVRRLLNYELRTLNLEQVLSVPMVAGCCMFFRNAALAKVGLFDEKFFLYFEDFDLSRRVKAAYETVYYPGAQVLHRADFGSRKDKKLFAYFIKSSILYFNKWGWLFDPQRRAENLRTLKQEASYTEPRSIEASSAQDARCHH
jgi:GT2 family glycosyltransferase